MIAVPRPQLPLSKDAEMIFSKVVVDPAEDPNTGPDTGMVLRHGYEKCIFG